MLKVSSASTSNLRLLHIYCHPASAHLVSKHLAHSEILVNVVNYFSVNVVNYLPDFTLLQFYLWLPLNQAERSAWSISIFSYIVKNVYLCLKCGPFYTVPPIRD